MKWLAIGFYSLIDVAAAAALAYFADPINKVFVFFCALSVLWLLPMAIGLFSLMKFWLWYHLSLKRHIVRVAKADFHKNSFPSSSAFFDIDAYFFHVMADKEIKESVRMRAAYLAGEMAGSKLERPFTLGAAVTFAYAQALEEYRPDHVSSDLVEEDTGKTDFFTIR